MTPTPEAVVRKALEVIGTPYLWAGKGNYVVREGKVLPVATAGCAFGLDCSGLVTWAVHQVGGPDLRGGWGSAHMLHHLRLPDPDEVFLLALYPGHVAIDLGNGLVLEAAGGDSTTLTYEDAQRAKARVRVGFELRHDRIAVRSLRALLAAPVVPPPLPTT